MDYSVPRQRTFLEAAPARVAPSMHTASFTGLNKGLADQLRSLNAAAPYFFTLRRLFAALGTRRTAGAASR